MQRPDWLTAQAKLIERARLCQRVLWIEKCPGLQLLSSTALNLRQAGFDELLRSDHTVANQPRRFRR